MTAQVVPRFGWRHVASIPCCVGGLQAVVPCFGTMTAVNITTVWLQQAVPRFGWQLLSESIIT